MDEIVLRRRGCKSMADLVRFMLSFEFWDLVSLEVELRLKFLAIARTELFTLPFPFRFAG